MNRYSVWKYVIIVVALVLGFFYTLPNFFGEVPPVQVSPARSSVKLDTAVLARVEAALKDAALDAGAITLDGGSLKARFANTDEQLKAKDALQTALGDDYVVALNLLSRSPQWLASIGALPMYLGLDLRGGVHFLMQVDMKAALSKKLEAYSNDIRGMLRTAPAVFRSVARRSVDHRAFPRGRAARKSPGTHQQGHARPRAEGQRGRRRIPHQCRSAHRGPAQDPGIRAAAEHHHTAQPS